MLLNIYQNDMESEEQIENNPNQSKPWLFKPGISGNPGGRPKGSVSLKTWAKNMLSGMTDEERIEFLKGLNKIDLWKMAEGNPAQDLTSGGEKIQQIPIYGGQSVQGHDGHKEDIQSEKEN